MKTPTTATIRNVALIGHSNAGKTTVVEAALARAGAIPRRGSVEAGTTVSDGEPEEVKRTMSLSLAVAPLEWTARDGRSYKINLIDTPGYTDFAGEVDAALSVADLAVLVVSAVDGIEAGTEAVWDKVVEHNLPRFVFVNKDDKPQADFAAVLADLKDRFGSGFIALDEPDGESGDLQGVTDVLSGDGQGHDDLVEEIVSGDDEQLEAYLFGDVPDTAALERTLAHEVDDCLEFPVLVGSATADIGIDRLLDYICEVGPAPRPTVVGLGRDGSGGETEIAPDPGGKPLVFVFKTLADPFVGQVSMFKVLSGTLVADERLTNHSTGNEERLHGVFHLRGKDHLPADQVVAGDLAAVAKLADTGTGATLSPKDSPVQVPVTEPAVGTYAVALLPRTQADDDKMTEALGRLIAEDPWLSVQRNDETGQTVLRALGDSHVSVALERLERKFGVKVDTEAVRVAYRETIAGQVEVEGRLKKQSGGHGQFAVVNVRVSPRERGAGLEFVSTVVGGSIPKNYLPAVERGITETMAGGGLHGFPIVDVAVDCFDGKAHSVDSSDMAFRTAASLALQEALRKAGSTVLEPVSRVTVTVPEDAQGDILGDLNSRRGRVLGTDSYGSGRATITANVPESELSAYAVELRSMTHGRGSYVSEHSHYDALPGHLVAGVTNAG